MGLKLCVTGKKLTSATAKAVLIMREHLRDNWLTAFAMLKDLIQPLILEKMKDWSIPLPNCSLAWEQEVCKYFYLIHESQLTVLKSYVQLKSSRFSQLPET